MSRARTASFFVLGLALATAGQTQSLTADPLDAAVRVPRIAIGSLVLVGEDHPAPDLTDFPATVESDGGAVEARWIERSVKWVRAGDGLPLPRARLRVVVHAAPERALLRWRGQAVALQDGTGGSFAEIWVPLLEGGEARVEVDGGQAARVKIAAKSAPSGSPSVRHAIDHSCSPWNISIKGLDDAYLSMNCRMTPVGHIGTEEAMLEIRWAAAGVTLPDGSVPPLAAKLRDGRPARLTLVGPDGSRRVVELTATVPPRLHRMRLAWGAGPYSLSSSGSGNGVAGAAMLYANFRLRTADDGMSIRAFEAAVSQSSANTAFFNNFGLYFAYDLARVWDSRLHLTALLGMQTVTLAPQGLERRAYSTTLAPQGFEISYPDAFGRKNEILSGGLFLQPTVATPYHNLWLRYGGGRWFGELNYISWRSNDRYARMPGVSVGMPFASLF
jgi:hypothetical protein